jgi:extradiol dioxygenase family protein
MSLEEADLLQEGLLDNTPIRTGRYIAHVAVPCRDLDEAARWYAEVLGAQPVRRLKDRVTFSFGGVLQLVCHLERRANVQNPRAYPRHHGLTFLRMADYSRMKDHVESLGIKFLVRPAVRFANSAHEHQTFMVADPSGNVVEFKCYVRPECSY